MTIFYYDSSKEKKLRFSKPQWKNYSLAVGFENNQCSGFGWGIHKDDDKISKLPEDKLKELNASLKGFLDSPDHWPWYDNFPEVYCDWWKNIEPWIAIQSGIMVKMVIGKIVALAQASEAMIDNAERIPPFTTSFETTNERETVDDDDVNEPAHFSSGLDAAKLLIAKQKKRRSAIETLQEELWGACVMQRAAQDQEVANRWQTNELSHLKEGFRVQPMPDYLNSFVQDALAEWQQIENKACHNLNRGQILSEFEKARDDFLNGGNDWRKIIAAMELSVNEAVLNIDWVNLFAWVLPNADKENAEEHKVTGRIVTAIFYIEQLIKHGSHPEHNNLKRIEARWQLVNQI